MSLESLGVKVEKYEPCRGYFGGYKRLQYSVSINRKEMEGSQRIRYMRRILKAIARDSKRNIRFIDFGPKSSGSCGYRSGPYDVFVYGCLEFSDVARELYTEAKEKHLKNLDTLNKDKGRGRRISTLCVAGGLIGLILGYTMTAELTTLTRDYTANANYLLTPIIALTQSFATLLGVGAPTAFCAFAVKKCFDLEERILLRHAEAVEYYSYLQEAIKS